MTRQSDYICRSSIKIEKVSVSLFKSAVMHQIVSELPRNQHWNASASATFCSDFITCWFVMLLFDFYTFKKPHKHSPKAHDRYATKTHLTTVKLYLGSNTRHIRTYILWNRLI